MFPISNQQFNRRIGNANKMLRLIKVFLYVKEKKNQLNIFPTVEFWRHMAGEIENVVSFKSQIEMLVC